MSIHLELPLSTLAPVLVLIKLPLTSGHGRLRYEQLCSVSVISPSTAVALWLSLTDFFVYNGTYFMPCLKTDALCPTVGDLHHHYLKLSPCLIMPMHWHLLRKPYPRSRSRGVFGRLVDHMMASLHARSRVIKRLPLPFLLLPFKCSSANRNASLPEGRE